MNKKYYWVNFSDDTQMRIRESEGEALQKMLLNNVKWVQIAGSTYNTNKISSVVLDYADEDLINTLIPRK